MIQEIVAIPEIYKEYLFHFLSHWGMSKRGDTTQTTHYEHFFEENALHFVSNLIEVYPYGFISNFYVGIREHDRTATTLCENFQKKA